MSPSSPESLIATPEVPDSRGRFGPYGGIYVPETLSAALHELDEAYRQARDDASFGQDLVRLQRHYIGRPTPLYHAERLSSRAGGAAIYLKREDLAHTGAHKINNSVGQALLALRMGKHRVIAETGAGQHGVATATAAALFGLECDVFMGEEDIRRQAPNVKRMELLGTRVIPVASGSGTLKDAINAAMRNWMETSENTNYIFGSVCGPHPFPMVVRDFQSVIGRECREQCLEQFHRLPDVLVACVGGGSNAAGFFYPFVSDRDVQLVGVEAGGYGDQIGDHAAPLNFGSPGVLHGSLSYVMQDDDGQTAAVHSISAGLDYPGVGPEHAYWLDSKRATYTTVTDQQALDAFQALTRDEGIIPALESAHAVAHSLILAAKLPGDRAIIVNLSGRGDKDLDEVLRLLG